MSVENLDYKCYVHSVERHAQHQEDWLAEGYAPLGYYLKDFCLLKDQDTWHLFHIAGTDGVSCCMPGNEIWFGHATTKDFVTWTTHVPCFYIDPSSWDAGHVFAPFVIERDGKYYMYYTGCAIDNTQRIGLAVSDDLFTWQRASDKPVIRPEEYDWAFCPTEKGSACRDAHVEKIGDEYHLYYTAVTNEGRGCAARATSTNMIDWTDCGPAYTAPKLAHCESCNVQEFDGKYLLFFGGHYEYWSYVISDNPLNWPEQEPIPLIKDVTAMEVIMRNGKRWLISYFKSNSYRMYLAIIDWSGEKPVHTEINTATQLQEFAL